MSIQALKIWKPAQVVAILLLVAAAFMCALTLQNLQSVKTVNAAPADRFLILDPGHGGIDGGAVALNGTKESDINLSLALKLRELASFCGQPTVMTRTDDSNNTDYAAEWRTDQHPPELLSDIAAPRSAGFICARGGEPSLRGTDPSEYHCLFTAGEPPRGGSGAARALHYGQGLLPGNSCRMRLCLQPTRSGVALRCAVSDCFCSGFALLVSTIHICGKQYNLYIDVR